MEKINVYIITYGPHRIEEEKLCIQRTFEIAQKQKDFDIQIWVCDNNSPKEFTEWLTEWGSGKIHMHLHPENIGKGRIVNLVHKTKARPSDYICSLDSDMIIQEDCVDVFKALHAGLNKQIVFKHGSFLSGVVVSDQLLEPCHIWKNIKISLDIDGFNYKTTLGEGVAGGCLFMDTPKWNQLGGYAEVSTIFGGNDGYVMAMMRRNGMIPLIAMDARVEHRGAHDTPELKEFHKWKVQQARRFGTSGKFESDTGFFDK
jgi:glycosyltransferase involved in cell wall biosynthesis